MNIKKIFSGTILLMAVCFSACSDKNSAAAETSGETISAAAETISDENETETAVTENQPDTFLICGNVYSADDIYIEIDGNSITEADTENIRNLKKLSAVSIENPSVPLVEMFSENPSVTEIELVKFDGDISEYIDVLKDFEIISIDALRYSGKDSALIYRELSEASVKYEKNSDRLFELPTDGIALSASVSILPNGKDDFDTWTTPSDVLIIGINNLTDTAQTAQKLELIYESENGDETAAFKNGENFLPLDIVAEPQGKALLTVDNDMFDYKNAETGVYKVRVTFENDTAETEFIITNSNGLEFLTEEQRELFDRTWKLSVDHTSEAWIYSDSWRYEKEPVNISDEALETLCECYTYDYVTEHSDRFCINSEGGLYENDGRSGSPVYEITFFSPISVSEEQVDFKATVVNFHGDDPYFVWFYELNYRMVKTDSGWRFDKFQFWR